mgnify:CR=1 FL=1
MLVLGIESSCDETAAAVVEDGRNVLSSVVASQVEEHKLYGGVVPEIASRRHAEAIVGVVQEALDQARLTLGEVEAVAVTHAPGLIGALLVGVNRKAGADFTFIMALPVMVVACLYELLKNISALAGGDLAVLTIGFVTAFVVGYFSIVWFMKFLQRSTLTAFGIYRILLALVTVWYFYM